jgi:hypothetical protein
MLPKIIAPLALLYFQYQSFLGVTKIQKIRSQLDILHDILKKNSNCEIWKRYHFKNIESYQDYIFYVPIVRHEDMIDDIDLCMQWMKNILSCSEIIYFAQTAWTTTGSHKYIPVTKECLTLNHFAWWRELIANYLKNNSNSKVLQGKSLILWWWFFLNPYTEEKNIGYISAILQKESGILWTLFREPSEEIAFWHDWDKKIAQIIETCKNENITSMWWVTSRWLVLMEELLKKTRKKNILEIRPNFSLYISWGLNFEPYRNYFEKLFPSTQVQFYQAYNASEWFFGIQYSNESTDMILLTNHGVFYEFIDMDSYFQENKLVISLSEIQVGKRYALLITSYAWLYRYEIGDVIIFTDVELFLFQIVWRTKVYIDVFSEHVIVDNTDKALLEVCEKYNIEVFNYHVAPQFADKNGQWCHEWIIEIEEQQINAEDFAIDLDNSLKNQNSFYAWKRAWNLMMQLPVLRFVEKGTFIKRFERKWKLWWQFKIPKLSNDRKILNELLF